VPLWLNYFWEPNLSEALKIMVVDEDEARGRALASVLQESGYKVVGLILTNEYLPSVMADAKPDVVLIDISSPSRDTLEMVSSIHRDHKRPVVMFASDDDEKTVQAAVEAGVSAYVADGLSLAKFKPIIQVAIAHFLKHQSLERELSYAKSSLDERKHIDRAKGLLMEKRRCNENEAFALLRKMAMDRKERIGKVAMELVEMFQLVN
jgi:response regulator NasT